MLRISAQFVICPFAMIIAMAHVPNAEEQPVPSIKLLNANAALMRLPIAAVHNVIIAVLEWTAHVTQNATNVERILAAIVSPNATHVINHICVFVAITNA